MACVFDEVSPRMLAELDPRTADACMQWLRTLSFVERTGETVRLHTLVRDAVVARLGRRDPARLADLVERGHRFYLDTFTTTSDPTARLRLAHQFLGQGRHVPSLRPLYRVSDDEEGWECTVHPASPSELPYLVELVERDEGRTSAAIVERWLEHPETRVWSVRDEDQASIGFLVVLRLSVRDRAAAVAACDPVVEAIFDFVEALSGALPDDEMVIHRSLITRDGYQRPGIASRYLHAVKAEALVWHGEHSPTVAHLFSVYGDPETWTPVAFSVGYDRLTEHEVTIEPRHYALVHRFVRGTKAERWFAEMCRALIAAIRALAPTEGAARSS